MARRFTAASLRLPIPPQIESFRRLPARRPRCRSTVIGITFRNGSWRLARSWLSSAASSCRGSEPAPCFSVSGTVRPDALSLGRNNAHAQQFGDEPLGLGRPAVQCGFNISTCETSLFLGDFYDFARSWERASCGAGTDGWAELEEAGVWFVSEGELLLGASVSR